MEQHPCELRKKLFRGHFQWRKTQCGYISKIIIILRIMVCNLCAKFHDPFRIPGELNSSVIHDFSTHEVFTST